MTPAQTVSTTRPSARRWRIAFLLSLGVLVAFLDRVNLSVSQNALHEAFGISLVAFGYLSSAYSWTYALMQVPAGTLLDRWGVRRVGRIGSALWSLASFAAAASTGVTSFLLARFLLGIGESPVFPGNAKALGYWFPENERSLATAITDSAAKFSTAIGIPFLGLLLLHFGWRWSFVATGVISFGYFILFYAVYRNPSEDGELSAEEAQLLARGHAQPELISQQNTHAPLSYLLKQPKVLGLALGWAAYNYSFFLLLTWLPSYLSLAMHIDLFHSVLYTSVPWLFATASDLIVGGWLVDSLIRRGHSANRVRQSVLIGGTALGLGILGAANAHSSAMAIFWISISLGGLAAAAPVAWTVPSLIAPQGSVGRVAGIANFCGQVAAICAPVATGYIATITHAFSSAFVTATVILVLGMAGYAFLLGRIEPIPEPAERMT
jgi:ACS family D-galactonate transporter-like MFS transporter